MIFDGRFLFALLHVAAIGSPLNICIISLSYTTLMGHLGNRSVFLPLDFEDVVSKCMYIHILDS